MNICKICNATTEEPIVFTVGELYEDGEGEILEFVFDNRTKPMNDEYNALVFRHTKSGTIMLFDEEGKHNEIDEWNIIKKHTPKPVEHTIDMWVNVYPDLEVGEPCCYFSREEADEEADVTRVACLHIKQKFVEGEGL